jgi:phospholipase/lecithinase/hemolysin
MKRTRRLLLAFALAGFTSGSWALAYSGLVIFGDSLSDAGNVAALVGSDPGQVITGNAYIPSRPYASGQFTNGNVWARSFAGALGLPGGGVASLAGGSDFAFGGALTATDGAGLTPSVLAQANQFLGAVGGVAPGGALYVVEGGGNDARDLLSAAAASANPAAVIGAGAVAFAQSAGQIVDLLQAAGAKNILLWDVPNLALAPAVLAQGAGASFLGGQVSLAMNAALAARMASETGLTIFDIYGLQNRIVANPASFGLSNVTDACGAVASCDAAHYLFWDGIHPTAAAHSLIAQDVLATVTAVPEPATAGLLVAGLVLTGWRVGRRSRRPVPAATLDQGVAGLGAG